MAKPTGNSGKTPPPNGGKPRGARRVWWLRLIKWGFVVSLWGVLAFAALVGWYAYDLPAVNDIPALERRPAVTLLAADGTPFARFGETAARAVTIAELPPYVPRAVIATEDARFYSHFGIDVFGLARAMFANLRAGRIVQGGSTITQQLAKNLFFGPERTIERKVQEIVLALWLERRLSKDQILALYLNRVYFGAGNFGIEAAAQSYFGKPAAKLSLNEAAMLAGLLKAPTRYAPTRDHDRAAGRAQVVLERMAAAGFITQAQANVVKNNPARLGRQQARIGRYFADWAFDAVRSHIGARETDLMVQTTLDAKLQRAAEMAADAMLSGPARERDTSQLAILVMTPDGAVRAMVGGADYGRSQFNRATQALRQPGSAFKPIVYLAGLEAGLDPDTVMQDAPVRIGAFQPANYDGKFRGPVTLTEALAHSLNSVAVRVLERAGVDRVIRAAERLGITSEMRREAGLALGSSEMTLAELVSAYAAFANGGDGVFAHGVKEIRDGAGRVLYRRMGEGPGRVVSPARVADMTRMMEAVIARGTGRAAAFPVTAAGKTGTTQDYRDALFVGYTGHYVAGVWMGNDNRAPMRGVTGGTLPARLWREVMVKAHEGVQPKPPPVAAKGSGGGFWSNLFGGLSLPKITASKDDAGERSRSPFRNRDRD